MRSHQQHGKDFKRHRYWLIVGIFVLHIRRLELKVRSFELHFELQKRAEEAIENSRAPAELSQDLNASSTAV